jgi:hypothetical protein
MAGNHARSGAVSDASLLEESAGARQGGVTLRALVVALCLVALLIPAGFYGELVYGGTPNFSTGAPAMAPLFVLVAFALINPLLVRFGIRVFSRRELLSVYAVVLLASPVISHGLLPWLLPYNIAQQYLARAIPEWQNSYLPAVPTWFGPTDFAAAEGYFQGRSAVPWQLWWIPLSAWLSFFVALVGSTLCLVVLMRRQWITHERLPFPIAQVPLETVQEGDAGSADGRLPANWPFWIAFLVPCAIGLVNKLAILVPAVPSVPISGATLMQARGTGPLAGLGAVLVELVPWEIAIAYLIPKELSFSCWFFWFVRLALTMTAIGFGADPRPPETWWGSGFPAPMYQGGGAVIAIALWTLWVGRRHLLRALRMALRGGEDSGDPGEAVSYRWAVLGFAASFVYLVGFCIAAGARPLLGAAMIGLIITYYIVWTRLRAETGLGFVSYPFGVDRILSVPSGGAVFRLREIILLYDLRWAYYPGYGQSAEVLTGNALDALKIADSARVPARRLMASMLLGLLISLAVATYVIMTGMYHYGLQNTRANALTPISGWLGPQLRIIGSRISDMSTNPTTTDPNGILAFSVGVVVTLALGALRQRFWWWPFHPIGYLAASCWPMQVLWMPYFVGWLLKTLVVRYGGLRLYRRTIPLAIGLIVGDFVNQGIWVIVAVISKGRV